MSQQPRAVVETAARNLLLALADLDAPQLRVVEADGRVACLILVWDAKQMMPPLGGARRDGSRRAGCKRAILEAVRAAGKPLTRKEILRLLRDTRAGHGPGTVAKALADLTGAGDLINPKDKRGYRLAEWPRPRKTPTLFD